MDRTARLLHHGDMAAEIDPTQFKDPLVILSTAALVIPLFYRLKLSPVLGFMAVGLVLGPFGLGALVGQFPWLWAVTISDTQAISDVAELGVALLLFMIGLELSFERLYGLRRLVFGLGGLKVLACFAAITLFCAGTGQTWTAALVAGVALAQSSTAIIIQILSEQKKITAPVGRASFSILLFEDLSIVAIIFAISVVGTRMAAAAAGAGGGEVSWLDLGGLQSLGLIIAQAALVVAAILGIGRLVLRPLFREVARTRSPELFMAACLLVVLGTGLVTAAAGLSMALGALIAGLLLAETEYRRQIEVTIEPFKGLLLGVFLISIGMGIDLLRILEQPLYIAGLVAVLILAKGMLTFGLVRLFGFSTPASLHAGLIMGPAGEFGFVTLGLAVTLGIIKGEFAELALLVTAISMALIPLLHVLGERLTRAQSKQPQVAAELALPDHEDDVPRVIIAGFGRVGSMVAEMLEAHDVPYVAVDLDPDQVTLMRQQKKPVYFGDCAAPEMLRKLDLATARALVITTHDVPMVSQVVRQARAERPDLLIVARARDANHAAQLYALGATDTVPETIEASLQLSEAVLVDIGIPMGKVITSIHERRDRFRKDVQSRSRGRADQSWAMRGPKAVTEALPGGRRDSDPPAEKKAGEQTTG